MSARPGIFKRRSSGVVFGLLCAAVLALGFWRLHFDLDVLNLLPPDLPAAKGIKLYQENFANARELIITVQAKDPEICENATRVLGERLRAATNIAFDVTWQPLWLERPADTAEFLAYSWLNQPPEVFQRLSDSLSASNLPGLLAESREALTTSFSPEVVGRRSYDPLRLTELPKSGASSQNFGDGSSLFASADGTFHLIFLKSAIGLGNYKQCAKWINAVQAVATEAMRAMPESAAVKVRYTGRPAFVSEISTGMQKDMAGPSGITLGVIAALFCWTHRRLKPLLWLTALLLLVLAMTCAIGGLVFGSMNIVSFGFASILLGLAEDFGIVLYQESRSHPHLNASQVRAIAAPGVFWSTITTCSAFLVLNFGGLPGLGQLGTLVAIGIAVAAFVMLYAYLPPLMRNPDTAATAAEAPQPAPNSRRPSLIGTAVVLGLCAVVLIWKRPGFDNSPSALRPRTSEAYSAAEEIKLRLKQSQEPLWVLINGNSEAEVLERLRMAEHELNAAVSNHTIAGLTMPTTLWPNALAQKANAVAAKALVMRRDELRRTVLESGFTTNAFALASSILDAWSNAASAPGVFWPTNEGSRWILEKFTARNGTNFFALGLVEPLPESSGPESTARVVALSENLAAQNILLSGWGILGSAIISRVKHDFWKVLVPMILLVLVSLWLAFKSFREVLLSIAALLATGFILWALMSVAGWSWNLLNLMAIPLLLGMGVDFSIHMQFALKRHHGNLAEVRGSIGRALLLAGSTTVAGFASLTLSNNAGLASLGKVCATGILIAMLVSVYLLPNWWARARRVGSSQ